VSEILEVHHWSLCPISRKLRIVLREKGVEFEMFQELFWQRNHKFLKMNPAGETPVLINEKKKVIAGNSAIFEYLEEHYPQRKLFPANLDDKAEVRRIIEWFDNKFYNDVTKYILFEKVIKTIAKTGAPNSQVIFAAKANLKSHLDYIAFLLKDSMYLFLDEPTLADFTAAAHLSVLDYVGDIEWSHYPSVKHWYSLMKSRPSFRAILKDRISNFAPPMHYQDPDF
jgi:glutathione S-transferase